eukprot:NODE_849_length_3547_cov_0.451856.p1 type:complete len:473 gc:universal NODE_849_length_3547_cov_0.451856:2922-1504(-)
MIQKSNYKDMGNEAYKQRDYQLAILYYSKGLEVNPQDEKLSLNLIAAYTANGWFECAIELGNRLLIVNPELSKAFLRLTQVYILTNRYKKGLETLDALERLNGNKLECKQLRIFIKQRQSEMLRGYYDFGDIYSKSLKSPNLDNTSYLKQIEIKEVPDKGKGIVLTRSVSCGQLIFTQKALMSFTSSQSQEMAIAGLIEDCLVKSADLFYANKLKQFRSNPETPNPQLNRNAIIELVNRHAVPLPQHQHTYALFEHSGYLNHSCIANCHMFYIGDLLVVKALKSLEKGEELTINYFSKEIDTTFHKRQSFFISKFQFICRCELCRFDVLFSKLHPEYSKLIGQFSTLSSNTSLQSLVIKCYHQLKEYDSDAALLRRGSFFMFWPFLQNVMSADEVLLCFRPSNDKILSIDLYQSTLMAVAHHSKYKQIYDKFFHLMYFKEKPDLNQQVLQMCNIQLKGIHIRGHLPNCKNSK